VWCGVDGQIFFVGHESRMDEGGSLNIEGFLQRAAKLFVVFLLVWHACFCVIYKLQCLETLEGRMPKGVDYCFYGGNVVFVAPYIL
jgi:hypothetical protein